MELRVINQKIEATVGLISHKQQNKSIISRGTEVDWSLDMQILNEPYK